jgi:hypothetical protein
MRFFLATMVESMRAIIDWFFFCHTRQLIVNLTVRDESLDDHTDNFIRCVRVNVKALTVPPISKYKIR